MIWHDITDVSSYALAATQSLLTYMDTYGIAGFDIDFEFGIVDNGKTSSSWLQSWCQVIVSLKEVQLQPCLLFFLFQNLQLSQSSVQCPSLQRRSSRGRHAFYDDSYHNHMHHACTLVFSATPQEVVFILSCFLHNVLFWLYRREP